MSGLRASRGYTLLFQQPKPGAGEIVITVDGAKAHGLGGSLEEPDWAPLTLPEVDALLRRYPRAGGAERILSHSPRPFSAASVVATPMGQVFVKRHARSVRDREGLLEEHRLIAHLATVMEGDAAAGVAGAGHDHVQYDLVQPVLADIDGETAVTSGDWTYELHPVACGVDLYEQAISWTPFLGANHGRAAGRALAQLHQAARSYRAPARKAQQLVSSFTIFAGHNATLHEAHSKADGDPYEAMEAYLEPRPLLREYTEERDWRRSFDGLLIPFHRELEPWLTYLEPLWTHNDFHASNLTWSGDGADAQVSGVIDFGLADRTNAVHDVATAIERNIVEWLRMAEPGATILHLDHLDALLAGYEELSPLSYEEARALAAMLPLVHCEFALSETDYFLSVLQSREKAYLAYEGYFMAHAEWFHSTEGQRLVEHLERWVEDRPRVRGGQR
jgi:Ser/Thr protein kinase RdoA (MazF antagonist)